MEFKSLTFEEKEGVGVITLNRPERLNSIDLNMRQDFAALIKLLRSEDKVKVAVITGAGKAFCVGADLSFFETVGPTKDWWSQHGLLTRFFDDLEALEKPVIAAINGTCVGGGVEMALSCDLRIAVEDARFGFPENNIGLIPGVGGSSRLPRYVGLGKAKELILTGQMITASEAERIGLINHAVNADGLWARVMELARLLSEKAPVALGMAKRLIMTCSNVDLNTGRALEAYTQGTLLKTEDHREGLKAFREKRRPRFIGG